MKNHIIIFDLDGTLIDSAPDVCGALNRTLAKIDRRAHSVEEAKTYLGHGAPTLMEKALKATGDILSPEATADLTNQFLTDYADNPVIDTVVFPGVFKALDTILSRGAKLALCTNKPSITTAPVLDILKLTPYFEARVCGDQASTKKPHGDHIHETIRSAGGDKNSRAIMIGDSENDIYAAVDAGVPSIAVTFGYALGAVHDLGADAMINHFDDLISTIETVMVNR